MTDPWISGELERLRVEAAEVAERAVAPRAEAVDQEARWPGHGVEALGEAGLLGLHVPTDLGGRGQGLGALALVTEEVGRACGSTGLVYGMHCVGSRVLATNPTPDHEERFLRPIVAGEHVTSLALSEPGSGVHFYLPRTTFRREGDAFVLDGTKAFVTSGGHADSYVASAVRSGAEMDPGTFSVIVVEDHAPGMAWGEPWHGFGMRGNSSRTVRLEDVRVPETNLVGEEGDEVWYAFEVIIPYFIVAMASVYLGVARGTLEHLFEHLAERRYEPTGTSLAEVGPVGRQVGRLWTRVECARQLLHHAARLGDAGDPGARNALFASKIEVANAAVAVTDEAMTLAGGRAYGENTELARRLRDARASHLMSPSTQLLESWLGRSLLDLPLLEA